MLESVYPVFMSKNIKRGATFFMELFNFKETFVSDWYISLKDQNGFELSFIDCEHETIPSQYKESAKGIILNFEVDNVDKIYEKIVATKEIKILLEIKDEAFGQRHFMIESPDEFIIDVIEIIPPSKEFLAQYLETSEENETE